MRTVKRRRRQGKTDYKLRLTLLKANLPRIVIRRTNKYFSIQVVESNESKDKVIGCACSSELLKNGWDKKFSGSLKNVSAGYLTGLMLAKKIKKGKFILDLGMARTIGGNRIYAVAKGLIDGGLDIPISEKVFPSNERLNGEHLKPEIKEMINKVKENLK